MNLIQGIQEEIKRVRELRKQYVAIGPVGAFGVVSIDIAIKQGEDAIGSGDVIAVVEAYKELKSITG